MIKELEALERIDDYVDKDYDYCQRGDYKKDYKTIKQYILKSQEQEKEIDRLENQCLDLISDNIRLKNKAQEQEKLLDIIKPLCEFVETKSGTMYLVIQNIPIYIFKNREEFELLKKVLKIDT